MDYYPEEFEKEEEEELKPDDWTEADIAWWKNFRPLLVDALKICALEEVKKYEAMEVPDITITDDFKIKMNKLFRNTFGENTKVPHPEVETSNRGKITKS